MRCYSCSQENCGYGPPCTCSCHCRVVQPAIQKEPSPYTKERGYNEHTRVVDTGEKKK